MIGAVEGTVGHDIVHPVRQLQLLQVALDQLGQFRLIAGVARERLHQKRQPCFVFDHHRQHGLIQLRTVIA